MAISPIPFYGFPNAHDGAVAWLGSIAIPFLAPQRQISHAKLALIRSNDCKRKSAEPMRTSMPRQDCLQRKKMACFTHILGSLGGWFLGSLPLESRHELTNKMLFTASRADVGSAPRVFH
jgi:hypothetical protein